MLLIDADTLVYRVGFATDGEPFSTAKKLMDEQLTEIIGKSGSTSHRVFIKGEGNFRFDIDPAYKAGRSSKKPEHYEALRKHLISGWLAETVNGQEVDDRVSALLWDNYKSGAESDVLYSPDKDLKNTPGWHLDDKHDKPYWISEMQANRHFIYQLLAGDRVDNIKGLPEVPDDIKKRYGLKSNKVGDRTAKKIMSETSDDTHALALAMFLYHVHYGSGAPEEIDKNATLLWMTRDYDEPPEPVPWMDYFDLKAWTLSDLWYQKWQEEQDGA